MNETSLSQIEDAIKDSGINECDLDSLLGGDTSCSEFYY